MYLFSKGPIFQILISHWVKLWPFLKRSSKKSIRFWMADQPTIQKVGKAFDHPIQYWFLELFSIPCSDLHKIVCYIYFTKNSSHSYLKFHVPFSTISNWYTWMYSNTNEISTKTVFMSTPYLPVYIESKAVCSKQGLCYGTLRMVHCAALAVRRAIHLACTARHYQMYQ